MDNKQGMRLAKYIFGKYNEIEPHRGSLDDELAEHFVFRIEQIMDELDEDSRRILDNDFLDGTDKTWYLDYYCRASYYRHRERAIREFINLLNR
ncbi:MAG: hypothetical protein IKE59_01055 [Erysipelotrichaceae bacterium]|nr:hypothetical protein [Erysipelotrichaceae bacterium]